MLINSNSLVSTLDKIVDSSHLEEVKHIVVALTNIQSFKDNLSNTDTLENMYFKIEHLFKNQFNIDAFEIIKLNDNIKSIEFSVNDLTLFEYECTIEVNKNEVIKFSLNNSHLNEFDKLYLDNYIEEICHILYIQYVLLDLKKSLHIDPLTKLKNRLAFKDDMEYLIPLAIREKMNIGVLLINIDRFRAVNDEHGTHFGDNFLKLYAHTIIKHIRTSDIAIRFAGGEFLVLLMNVIDSSKAMEIAEELKNALSKTFLLTTNNDEFKKTVCIGVSMFPEDSEDIHEVVQNAELTLSDARDNSRNNVLKFSNDSTEIDFF